ncbi:hypothetical protein BV898_01161 [Hypsibius exemplaris]|uniref:Receptor ligand binding region domain-containing protein n=1 Tax=Hypsibius exemplaris TaxID=2072580 RepID=A0A1W0XCF1_HYPEX|nr:hypothetical protein BV898_01161 [Hypsibius exemplaris]
MIESRTHNSCLVLGWLVIFSCARPVTCNGLHLITTTSALSSASSANVIAPAYLIALEDMREKYPHLFDNNTITVTPVDVGLYTESCTPGFEGPSIDEFVRAYALATVRRSTEQIVILNAEDDSLVISCGTRSTALGGRYPTMMTVISGTISDAGMSLVALLDHVMWRSIAFIYDQNSGSIDAGRIQGHAMSLLKALQERSSDIDLSIVRMDSTVGKKSQTYYMALQRAANHSRIILCETLHRPLRELMASAYDLGMTVGNEYVFIYVYLFQIPSEPPPEWHENDQLDEKVKAVFRHTLVIRTAEPKWEKSDGIMERIVRRGSDMFNRTYQAQYKFNEFAVGCYGSVELLISTLNNTYLAGGSAKLKSPADFLRDLKNRTFNLTFESYAFLPDGTRAPNIILQRFDASSARFQVCQSGVSASSTLVDFSLNL